MRMMTAFLGMLDSLGTRLGDQMVDFDDIKSWAPELTAALGIEIEELLRKGLQAAVPQYVEDARNKLFEIMGRDAAIDATLKWIRRSAVAGYHGTRLGDAEVRSVENKGLIPLNGKDRRNRLSRALSPHPSWPQVVENLDATIDMYGPNGPECQNGKREGEVHLTLSRAGLTDGFNHYLKYGSEFDQSVARHLLGDEGVELLAHDGIPRVIRVQVPGKAALDSAHLHFTIDQMRDDGNVPNLVEQFLNSWSYRVAHPLFDPRVQRVDCGMVFHKTIPATWIRGVETVSL